MNLKLFVDQPLSGRPLLKLENFHESDLRRFLDPPPPASSEFASLWEDLNFHQKGRGHHQAGSLLSDSIENQPLSCINPLPVAIRYCTNRSASCRKNLTMPWAGIVDRAFALPDFAAYCKSLSWTTWRPSFIVLHNTGVPSLAQRPNGLTQQHILNLEAYYRDQQGWSAGPHLFVDDLQIWVFTPLTLPGVHSPSWNQVSIGIEMLGDYQTEEFDSGRGLEVGDNAISAMTSLSSVLGLDPAKMMLHHEDPKTTHKDCPGMYVSKSDVIARVQAALATVHAGDHDPQGAGV